MPPDSIYSLFPITFSQAAVTGIAMILYYLMDIPIGLSNLVLNIPVLILSLKFMGKFYRHHHFKHSESVALHRPHRFHGGLVCHQQSSCRCHMRGALSSAPPLGTSLPLPIQTAEAFDVIGAVIKKFYNLEIGYVVFGLNFIIIMSSAWIFTLEPAICTLIAMYINATVSSRIVIGFAQRKAAFIVSDKPLEVADTILRNIHHGATLLYGQGGFSGKDKKIVFAIVDLTQVTKLRHFIEDIDPHAFLFIMNTTDVIGRGFTSPLTPKLPGTTRYTFGADGKMTPTRSWSWEMEQESHK